MDQIFRILRYDDIKQRHPIIAGRLLGTRLAWMTRYAPLLDADEFTKFVTLMRNLGPFVIPLTDPGSRSRRQDRNPPITRESLLRVIHGHPDAVPLFQDLNL